MRKLFLVLVLVSSLVSFTACSSVPKASVSVERFLTAFQAGASSSDDLTEYFDAEGKYALKLNAFDAGSDNEELVETMNILMRDFSYEIVSQTMEKDTAVVSMKITAHDIAGAYRQWIDGIVARAMEWMTSGKTEEEILAAELVLLEEALVASPKDKLYTVDVHMVYVDKEWQIADSEENMPLLDALTGGFLGMVEDIEGPVPNIY